MSARIIRSEMTPRQRPSSTTTRWRRPETLSSCQASHRLSATSIVSTGRDIAWPTTARAHCAPRRREAISPCVDGDGRVAPSDGILSMPPPPLHSSEAQASPMSDMHSQGQEAPEWGT